MISTELATRILLTVIIVGAPAIDFCCATATATQTSDTRFGGDKNNVTNTAKPDNREDKFLEVPLISSASLDSPVSPMVVSTSPYSSDDEISERSFGANDAESRLMRDSSEDGILLPYEDDFPQPGGGRKFSEDQDMQALPSTVSFPARPLSLRITGGKALEEAVNDKDFGKSSGNGKKATFYIRNNCFGPRCGKQHQNNGDKILINSPEDWKNLYYSNKEVSPKKYDGESISRSNYAGPATTRYEDNIMESVSSNFHSQLAIPFVVVDDNSMKSSTQSSFGKRVGIMDRFSRMTTTTVPPASPEGWVKLKAISPDAYDPFKFSRNMSDRNYAEQQISTFSKRDSSSTRPPQSFSKRVGVELNPESFADRWGWSANGDDNNRGGGGGGGSRLPAWLEDQLKYGNRNSDQGKNWVKLEPIPVAGVSISKWVPKGTPSHDLPTTSWQTNRDRPNGGSQWWDRVDDNRLLTGGRPSSASPFLRPNNIGGGDRFNGGGGGSMGGWGSKASSAGSSLSSFDRYPTNSWNDIIYPDGPTSATVSWQQSKGGSISNYPSSFGSSGGGGGGGGGWGSDTRKPIVATGSWSAPPEQNNRFPSFINRFSDNRPSALQHRPSAANEDDPRWVLISNTRRVTSGGNNRGNDFVDRNKLLSYINRLHPDLDRRADFPFYESGLTSHRHGKDYWPFPLQGTTTPRYPPNKDEAFFKLNSTLSTLTPVLLHRGGSTVRPPIVGTLRPSRPFANIYDDRGSSSNEKNSDIINSISSTLAPLLSTYEGDGRATSSNTANLFQSSTTTPVRNFPGKIRQGLKNLNPVYAAVGAGMIPATLAAVMPMMLGRRKRRDLTSFNRNPTVYFYPIRNNRDLSFHYQCCKFGMR